MEAAVVYARVSTEDQRENGTSLESQVAACLKFAEQNNYRIIETFKESKSGASLNRPMLDQVRELVRAGAVQAVIFYALDRLSRDETDTLILAREFRSHGVELKCATTPLEDSQQGQFLLTLLAAVGKLERASIIERTIRGRRQAARNGKVMATRTALYGYTNIDGRLEIDETEEAWVRRVFDWYCVDGLSLLEIARRLYDLGVKTKRGGTWAAATVRSILVQEAYTGEYWWGKDAGRHGGQRRLRPRSEWIGPIAIPPIISRDMYDAAQERFEYNKINGQRNCKTNYLLRGLITCPLCGRRYSGQAKATKSTTNTYYECTKRGKFLPGEHCGTVPVNGHRAEEKVWNWVLTRLSDPNLLQSLIEGADSPERAQRERDEANLRELLALQLEYDRGEDKLIALYTDDAITLEKFKERRAILQEQQEDTRKSIAEIEARQQARAQMLANAERGGTHTQRTALVASLYQYSRNL